MSTELKRMYNLGLVTSRDRADLVNGEMQQATGIYYKPGNPNDAYKLGGRSTFGDTGTAAAVGGLALAQFDSGGTDYLLALSSGALYGATPGATGTFSSLYTLTGSGATLDSAHANDRFYLAMDSENRVLEQDGTLRAMGMQPPAAPLTVAAQTAGSVDIQPNANDSGWTSMANAYDASLETSSYAAVSSAGSTVGIWSFAANSDTGRKLQVLWALNYGSFWDALAPEGTNVGALGRIKIEMSENGGTSYTEVTNLLTAQSHPKQWVELDIDDATNLSNLKVKATLTYIAGNTVATFRIYNIRVIDTGGSDTNSASEVFYAYTEYAEPSAYDPGGESVPSEAVPTGSFSSQAAMRVTLPTTAQNSRTTHLRIYRTPDNGTQQQLGLIAKVPLGQATFDDTFESWPVSEQPTPLLSYVEYEAEGVKIRRLRDFPPPNLRRVFYYRGGLVGLSSLNSRAVYYSVRGLPESWPREYFIDAIPLEEHDELLDGVEVGGSAIIAAKGAMIRIDEFPQSVSGVFVAGDVVAIKGAPGCVGPEALTAVNYRGQSHAAWISPENGLLVTDGHQWDSIGNEIDWSAWDGFDKSGWVLTYYKHLRVLRMDYSSVSGGTNDRFMLFHIDKDHVKQGKGAKVTGPHYGASTNTISVQYASTTRVYTAHPTNGIVYLDHNNATGADSSNAYDASGTHPLILQGPRRYDSGWRSYTALAARLYHGDFGAGQTLTLDYSTGRDSGFVSQTRSQTVSLANQGGTQVDIARAGEWHEETLTHTGAGISHIGSLTVRARIQGDEGKQAVSA